MGDFAVSLAISYEIGAARDNRSILSAMDISPAEFFASFGQRINDLILSHRKALQRKRDLEGIRNTTHSTSDPKTRWVDGTPEYSLHICGLRKLFPGALFIHLVRDVDSVVRSLLNFHRVAGARLVMNEEEAYKYWLRRVNACLKAEQAYGPNVVYRLRYRALVENSESAIRSLLDFVGEPYSAKCLEPLAERINSSNVPHDFKSDDPATDPAIVEEARRQSAHIEETAQPSQGSPAAADEMEAAFQQSCLKVKTLEQELKQRIASQQQHYTAEIEGYKSQIEKQQQHYEAEIGGYKSQIARQQQHYDAEIDGYKSQIARQQQHYLSEIDDYKALILNQQQHYLAEVEVYKSQIARQEQHYTAEKEEYRSQIARQEQYYSNRLRKQLGEIQKLASWLHDVATIARSLRSSRFWRFASSAAAIEAKLFHRHASRPDRKLEKILARYSRWRASRPDIAKIESAAKETELPVAPHDSDEKVERLPEITSIHKVSENSAEA
jgi:hypothetical protein